ncbi:DUF1360 domain-containing protein [Streptomyces sp. NPDC050856]|uniref:DUF1360 domain-containing protein n=1 Tax=Streptomyces sp. NPDC050856 TaxID=3154939 RepID=UPI0033EA1B9A
MADLLGRVRRTYAGGADRPLGGYAAALTAFGTYTAAWAIAVRRSGRPLPERPEPWDLALTAVATFRLSRLLSKGTVTSPLRAPFTRYEGPEGPAEVGEEPRHGRRETVGELLTCPFCMSVWIGTTLTASRVLWPRATRTAMSAVAAVAGSDALQFAYTAMSEKVTKD